MAEIVSFGEWIQKRRNQLGLTRKGLAELVVCSPVTIKKIERDERRPSPQIAELLAEHLKLPESEHDNFMARARGEFVSNFISPAELSIEEAQAPVSEEDAPNHNLPLQLTPFFGRAQELSDIASKLANPNCRLLTILGAGGMGKTRLSIEAAQVQIENFTDGITYVELAPIEEGESAANSNSLASALVDALKIGLQGAAPLEEQLFAYLKRKEMLIVFDNFEHLIETAVFISHLLTQAPDVKVLTTSRERLNLQEEWLLPLHGLLYTDEAAEELSAAQLFSQRAQQIKPAFEFSKEETAVLRICKLVEGMPLAIEIAASWVAQLPCTAIANEIEKELDILTTEMRNVPDRHRSIRAVFDYSWERLNTKEQNALQKLSVFRGGFTLEAAQQVADASIRILSRLVGKSLLSVDENGRYAIHELLRQFAEEWLNQNETNVLEAHHRHCAFFLNLLSEQEPKIRGPQYLEMLSIINNDLDNIREWQSDGRSLIITICLCEKTEPFYILSMIVNLFI